jgi:hypothetical protein
MGINEVLLEQYAASASKLFKGESLDPLTLNQFHGATGLLLLEVNKRCLGRCETGSIKDAFVRNFRMIVVCASIVSGVIGVFATGKLPKWSSLLAGGNSLVNAAE